jgi:hypothetical protein
MGFASFCFLQKPQKKRSGGTGFQPVLALAEACGYISLAQIG